MRTTAIVRAALFTVLVSTPAVCAAQSSIRYVETVTVASDGSARVYAVVESASGFGTAVTVRAIAEPTNVTADNPGVPLRVDRRGGEPCLVVGGARADVHRMAITYDVIGFLDMHEPTLPHGNHRVLYGFENLTDARVDAFTGTIILPADLVVSAVDDVRPPISDATVDLPYRLGADAGRPSLTLSRGGLAFGDDLQVTFRVKRPGGNVMVFLIAGLLGAGYLVTFRDLVRGRPPGVKEAP